MVLNPKDGESQAAKDAPFAGNLYCCFGSFFHYTGAWAKYKPANYEKSVKFFTSSPNVLYYTLVA